MFLTIFKSRWHIIFFKNIVGSIKDWNTGQQPLDIRLVFLIYLVRKFFGFTDSLKIWLSLALHGERGQFSTWYRMLLDTIVDHLNSYLRIKVWSYETFWREGNNHFFKEIYIAHCGFSNTLQPHRVETVQSTF